MRKRIELLENIDASVVWDAIVVGAGPAGSVSAALLAERGMRVLLVEKREWPRSKACGGCVNAAGVRLLREKGLGEVVADMRGVELRALELRVQKMRMTIATPAGMAVDRAEFDARLVAAAVERGAVFLAGTVASLAPVDVTEDFRRVHLICGEVTRECRGRVVLACDGQRGGGGVVRHERWANYVAHDVVRVGFSATVAAVGGGRALPAGVVGMFVSEGEYVGLVRLASGGVHVGASLDPEHCNRAKGPRNIVRWILGDCGFDGLELPAETHFEGTGPLSGHRETVAGHRVMVIGDACGYVEPFTGEGISWAIKGACAAAALLPGDLERGAWPAGLAARWNLQHKEQIVRRQWWCKRLRDVLHRPQLARTCMRTARLLPFIPALVARRISA